MEKEEAQRIVRKALMKTILPGESFSISNRELLDYVTNLTTVDLSTYDPEWETFVEDVITSFLDEIATSAAKGPGKCQASDPHGAEDSTLSLEMHRTSDAIKASSSKMVRTKLLCFPTTLLLR
jgi:hypothetical protein